MMLKNYFKTALRNFRRNKLHSIINLLSLCIGITCGIFIYTYVQHEISYDRFFENADQIYRMEQSSGLKGKVNTNFAIINQYVNPGPVTSIPGIKDQTRFAPLASIFVKTNGKKIEEPEFWAADSSFFKLFDFTFLEGNRRNALSQPGSIVLTQKAARKYFGNKKALGKEITATFQRESVPLTVTGIVKLPTNTHLQFNGVASENLIDDLYLTPLSEAYTAYNYLLLNENQDPKSIENQLSRLKKGHTGRFINFYLKPLTDIHLYSAVRAELSPNSDIRYIRFLSAIAIILLVIAGINFTSLATAQALRRYKEAGIRKVLGAGKRQLVGQFLMEAILLSLIAISAGYLIIYYALPFFNTLAGSQFVFADFFDLSSILLFVSAAVIIGITAGIYPAVILSAFQPVKTLKGLAPSDKKGVSIWKSIVVIQFAVSIAMIICTVTIHQQLKYIQNKNLGFEKDRIITITNHFGEQYQPMITRLNTIPGIENVTISSYVPGISETSGTGLVNVPGRPDSLNFNWISVGYEYFDTFGIKLKEGRKFSKAFGADSTQAFMLNDAAVKALGLESPLGKELNSIGGKRKVIGVTENFNFLSLYQDYTPIVYLMDKSLYFRFSIKIAPKADISGTIAEIENAWTSLLPNMPFGYSFVDEQFDALYKTDQRMGKIFALFAALALFIACLGLFSLSSFTAIKKRKEIGIRKVLGATVYNILLSFYKNYAALIAAACVIAVPVSYLFISEWLQQFAFRIDMPVWVFLLAIAATLCIAFAAVSYESVKAAIADPVDTLKSK